MPRSVPNYLTTDADGNVGAEFTGHVLAVGLDIEAGASAAPPDDRKLRWIRTADGYVPVEQLGYIVVDGASARGLWLARAEHRTGSAFAQLNVVAGNDAGTVESDVNIFTGDGLGNNVNATIIRSDGTSDFARFQSPHKVILESSGLLTGTLAPGAFSNFDISGIGTPGFVIASMKNVGPSFGADAITWTWGPFGTGIRFTFTNRGSANASGALACLVYSP